MRISCIAGEATVSILINLHKNISTWEFYYSTACFDSTYLSTVFPSLRPAGLNFFYFGIAGIISEPGLISGTKIVKGLNFYFFVNPGTINKGFLL